MLHESAHPTHPLSDGRLRLNSQQHDLIPVLPPRWRAPDRRGGTIPDDLQTDPIAKGVGQRVPHPGKRLQSLQWTLFGHQPPHRQEPRRSLRRQCPMEQIGIRS